MIPYKYEENGENRTFLLQTHSQIMYLEVQKDRLIIKDFLKEFTNLSLTVEQLNNLQDIYQCGDKAFIHVLGNVVYLRESPVSKRFVVQQVLTGGST